MQGRRVVHIRLQVMALPQSVDVTSFPSVSGNLKIKIGNRSWRAASWSVAGATIKGDLNGLADGEVYPAALRFGDETILEISAAVSPQIGADVSRLVFTDISSHHAELLHQIVDGHQFRAENNILSLFDSANDNIDRQRSQGARLARYMRIAVMLLFTGTILSIAIWMLYLSLNTVPSVYAAVSAQGRTVSAPLSGVVTAPALEQGMRVSRGEPLFEIVSMDVARRMIELDAEEIRLLAAKELLGIRLETLAEPIVAYEAELMSSNLATPLSADGVLAGSGDDHSPYALASLDITLAQTAASIEVIRAERDLLSDQKLVLSPCDCVVGTLWADSGDRVSAQGALATLIDPETAFIQALVPIANAASLREGDTARVELANRQVLEGEVTAISYQSVANQYIGLSDRIDAARYARLDIAVPGLDPANIGMPVEVRVFSGTLERFLGWDMVLDIFR